MTAKGIRGLNPLSSPLELSYGFRLASPKGKHSDLFVACTHTSASEVASARRASAVAGKPDRNARGNFASTLAITQPERRASDGT